MSHKTFLYLAVNYVKKYYNRTCPGDQLHKLYWIQCKLCIKTPTNKALGWSDLWRKKLGSRQVVPNCLITPNPILFLWNVNVVFSHIFILFCQSFTSPEISGPKTIFILLLSKTLYTGLLGGVELFIRVTKCIFLYYIFKEILWINYLKGIVAVFVCKSCRKFCFAFRIVFYFVTI